MNTNLLTKRGLLLTLTILFVTVNFLTAQVAVNVDGSTPDASAMLDVKSSDKGLLIPRLTTAARNTLAATAVAGLMVYDTDLDKFFFFNGVTWDEGSTGGLWTRSGSYTYLSNSGDKVGIGTTFPGYNLDVRSSTGSAFLRVKSTIGYAGIIINKASESSNAYIIYRLGGEFNKGWYVGMINNNDFTISRNSITSDGTFYIDSISGNIGIGTITPQRTLEVKGGERTARITSSTSAAYLEFVNTNTTDWAIGSEIGSMRMQSSSDGFATTTLQYTFGAGFFHPASSNVRSLGLSPYRWSNVYSVDGDFSENVTIGDTLKVTGKAGIGIDTPARTLEVRGPWQTARISSAASGATLEFVSTTQDDWAISTWYGNMLLMSSTDNFSSKTDEYYFSTSSFYPWTNNVKTLGTSSKRWSNLYSVAGDFSGDVTVNRLMAPLTIYDGTNELASVYVNPVTAGSEDSSRIFLAEDSDATFGMYWMYDGVGNHMELWGKASATTYGPHITVQRNSGNVAIGGQTFATGYKLSVAGKIICEELRVDLIAGWPDYVFGKDYKLMPLKELDAFIETNGHLPNIPAAEEIKESGLEVGEMQRLMMEKIEELSLYIIQQQKEIDELKNQINKNRK
ncbi:MAG: hypothetical protein L3J66_06410 [Bacteroidales bacterium]|nr:hypothetical protein [Bacteroidales bacterium]